ncbi:MAG: hypothetical protein AABW89_02735 [Nanoarchaeota archaeon]
MRRVDQIWKEYLTTGEIPFLGGKVGRPVKPIKQWGKEIFRSESTIKRIVKWPGLSNGNKMKGVKHYEFTRCL